MSWIKKPSPIKDSCPGIKDFVRPNLIYLKCKKCKGDIEVWSDENKGVCIDCGYEWVKPDKEALCLEYCEYADKCKELIKK